ncbi:MAG: spore cortex biosynthesis protein YabQ [Desulfotomaculaceae bacterium]|nr:spore cortex biosynthesis protein YabQ [Desulfotomaculaceae bacterium]MDD4766571.1 spore cortex biosynthesis protein YabQ [Desulfotomaculaceae bacterium]
MEPLLSQARAFFITIGIGIIAAFGYDYYRAVRQAFKLKRTGALLGDLIFWLVTTALVLALLLLANWGELRMYVFLGLGLGALLYFSLFSQPVSRLIRIKFYALFKLWHYFVLVISYLWKALLTPFRFVIMVIAYPFHYCRLVFRKLGRRLKRAGKNFAGGVKLKISRIAFWNKKKE